MNVTFLRRPLPAVLTVTVMTSWVLAAGLARISVASAASPSPVLPTLGADQITSGTATAGDWCLDNSGGSNAAGNPIDIYQCNDTWDGQLWTVEDDGTVRIQNQCLDAPSTANGTQLVLDPCDGAATPGEQWQPMSNGSLANVASGRCMGITGGDPVSNGARIIIWTCNGADTQQWHLPAASTKAAVAADRLQLMYNDTGSSPTYLFENPCTGNCWWWSANELNALIDYSRKAGEAAGGSTFPGEARYRADVQDTYNNQNGPSSGFTINPYGTSGDIYYDDAGWWGLTWLNAYNKYGDEDYLTAAENIANYIYANALDTACGGLWQRTGTGANNDAIVNEVFFELAARLNRTTGDPTYLTWAENEWDWIKTHLIIEVPESSPVPTVATTQDLANPDAQLLVADHVSDPSSDDCAPASATLKSTYNQGVILGALYDMYKITGDSSYLTPAEAIATTVENDIQNSSSQVSDPPLVDQATGLGLYDTLSEPCTSSRWPDGCSEAGNANLQWKGIYIRNLACLAQDPGVSPSYSTFIAHNAWSVFNLDQNLTSSFSAAADLNLFGFLWDDNGNAWPGTKGSEKTALNEATQGSALDALTSNMADTASWC
jgi:hypothetical protein